ncbi:plasmid mobilization protein [Soonwooa purpurea]
MKSKTINIRVSNSEFYIIKNTAKKAGITMSEYIRATALNYNLSYKLTEDEIEIYKELNKYADNFRRIGNLFKLGDSTKVKEISVETAQLIRDHLNRLKL